MDATLTEVGSARNWRSGRSGAASIVPGRVVDTPPSTEGVLMAWAIPSLVVLVSLVFVLPLWPWSKGWTWVPTGMVGMIAAYVWLVTAVHQLA